MDETKSFTTWMLEHDQDCWLTVPDFSAVPIEHGFVGFSDPIFPAGINTAKITYKASSLIETRFFIRSHNGLLRDAARRSFTSDAHINETVGTKLGGVPWESRSREHRFGFLFQEVGFMFRRAIRTINELEKHYISRQHSDKEELVKLRQIIDLQSRINSIATAITRVDELSTPNNFSLLSEHLRNAANASHIEHRELKAEAREWHDENGSKFPVNEDAAAALKKIIPLKLSTCRTWVSEFRNPKPRKPKLGKPKQKK